MRLPTWQEIEAFNSNTKGSFKRDIPLHDLTVSIECVTCDNQRLLTFTWKRDACILSQAQHLYSEAGYLVGCLDILQTAQNTATQLSRFASRNMSVVKHHIQKYIENKE